MAARQKEFAKPAESKPVEDVHARAARQKEFPEPVESKPVEDGHASAGVNHIMYNYADLYKTNTASNT